MIGTSQGIRLELPSQVQRNRRRRRLRFIQGPIPIPLVIRLSEMHPRALGLMLMFRAYADTRGLPVIAGSTLLAPVQVDRRAKSKILAALEAADLITVERAKGRAPRVWFDPALFEVPY